MIAPYNIDGHKLAHRVEPETGTRIVAAGRVWLCWPMCVVLEGLASEPDHLPLCGMPLGLWSGPMDERETGESIFRAICAPIAEEGDPILGEVGIPWWARPLAEAGDGNEIGLLGMSRHPVVIVKRNHRVIGLVASSRLRRRPGLAPGLPSHDIHGRPWAEGQDGTGQRFTTPHDGPTR